MKRNLLEETMYSLDRRLYESVSASNSEIISKMTEEIEYILEEEEWDSQDFDIEYDRIFDEIYPGSNISAKDYYNIKNVVYKNTMSN